MTEVSFGRGYRGYNSFRLWPLPFFTIMIVRPHLRRWGVDASAGRKAYGAVAWLGMVWVAIVWPY